MENVSSMIVKDVSLAATRDALGIERYQNVSQPIRPRMAGAFYFELKRCVDLFTAISLLIILSPLMLIIAVAIRLTSPGPAILRQTRLTLGGREFTLLKFRTMRQDAESGSGPRLAQAGDPRVTKLGRLLRKTRLDELPQLINVVRGEMSLIGPRPERPEIARQLGEIIPGFDRRLGAKAGLTGLAQVIQGYPDDIEGYRTKLAWDIVYIRQQSFSLDLWIAFRTIGTVLSGSGAK